jgi:RNA polymerase sigma-70 factor (sigma-E family)
VEHQLRLVPGEAEDLTSFVLARRPALLRAARAITGDEHTAEDLLQATLVSVLPRWEGLREPRAADAYVRRAMVNQHHSWYRQPWRRHERTVSWLPDQHVPDAAPPDHGLWPLVAALPAAQRSAVVLRFYEGLSVAEAAAVLGCSTGTVKSNTSRGLAALRRVVHPDADAS